MFSRAHLLIERDFDKLQESNIWGVEASLLRDDNIFEWTAKILGLKGTAWEGGIFRLYLKFDEHYNTRPPRVCFHTIPFHPNVDMITGRPCIDFLDDPTQWSESYTLTSILLAIQMMLSSPVLENSVNTDAVNMLLYSPHTYKQMVQECVAASQRVEAGHLPHEDDNSQLKIASQSSNKVAVSKSIPPPTNTSTKKAMSISFEDYYTTWSGIATSKSKLDAKNPLLEAIKENPNLQAAHYGLPVKDMHTQMEKQLEEHSQLVYGKFRGKSFSNEQDKESKLEKINQMRKIYLQPKGTPRRMPITLDEIGPENTRVELVPENTRVETAGQGTRAADEPWEEEVDDLVTWTNNLNPDAL